MNGLPEPLASTQRMAYGLGLALCVGTPSLIAGLILLGIVPPGAQPLEGVIQQLGYLFTGLVFMTSAWAWWRSGQALRGFKALAADQRPARVLRETLLYAGIFESSSLCGLIYWMLVGSHAARHAWSFILLTPALFLALVPRAERWRKALEG